MNLKIKQVEVKQEGNSLKVYAIQEDGHCISYQIDDTTKVSRPLELSVESIAKKLITNYYVENKTLDFNNRHIDNLLTVKALLISKIVYI